MWKWFSRRPAPNPPENPETIRRQLKAAQMLLQARRDKNSTGNPTREDSAARDRRQEILPSDEPDATISYQPLPSRANDSTLAGALESVLQGQRVEAALFTQLYRGGFVFKDPGGQWTITAMGKELIERHKLIAPEGCLVAGVRCAAGWNKRSIVVSSVKEQVTVCGDHRDLA